MCALPAARCARWQCTVHLQSLQAIYLERRSICQIFTVMFSVQSVHFWAGIINQRQWLKVELSLAEKHLILKALTVYGYIVAVAVHTCFFFFFTTPQCWWKTVQLHFAHCVSPRSRCLLRYGDSRSAHVYFWDKTGIKEDKFLDLTMLFVFKHMAGYRFECNTYHKKKKSLGFHLHQYRHLWKQKGMPLGAWKWKIIAKSKYPIIYFLKCSKCCFIDR